MRIKVGSVLEVASNNYIISERIDEGGNGVVWKAKVNAESHLYAVKVLKDDRNKNKDKLARFSSECQFCKDIEHKHIIKVLDYVAEEGNAYCIMPYYSKNLRTIIDEENDSFVLLSYIIQLCEAIQFIHSKGIIHRDLKPENILVSDNGTLVLTDFGIAHF